MIIESKHYQGLQNPCGFAAACLSQALVGPYPTRLGQSRSRDYSRTRSTEGTIGLTRTVEVWVLLWDRVERVSSQWDLENMA